MKKYKKLRVFLIIVGVLIVSLIAVRTINGVRFSVDEELLGNFVLGGDMNAYPLEHEGMTVTVVKDGYINGFHVLPDEKSKSGLIVTFGGSDGGLDFDRSVALAKDGYEVVALFYFGQENQPESHNNVPLEFFGEFLNYAETADMDISTLTLIGTSKGAELALLLTNYFDEIDNVVLFAPASYVFQGGDMTANTSSWTYGGEALPYINLMPDFFGVVKLFAPMVINYPIAFRDFQYNMILEADNADEALIDVSGFGGNILIFVGADDQVWPADIMGQMIKDIAPEQTELIIYPDTGHAFLPAVNALGMANGGTIENNAQAQIDSDERLLRFLEEQHS